MFTVTGVSPLNPLDMLDSLTQNTQNSNGWGINTSDVVLQVEKWLLGITECCFIVSVRMLFHC